MVEVVSPLSRLYDSSSIFGDPVVYGFRSQLETLNNSVARLALKTAQANHSMKSIHLRWYKLDRHVQWCLNIPIQREAFHPTQRGNHHENFPLSVA